MGNQMRKEVERSARAPFDVERRGDMFPGGQGMQTGGDKGDFQQFPDVIDKGDVIAMIDDQVAMLTGIKHIGKDLRYRRPDGASHVQGKF